MTKSRLLRIHTSKLVHDADLYPRHKINTPNINDLERAYRNGDKLPPIVVTTDHRIVDGVHRWRMYKRVHKNGCEVDCEMRAYGDDSEAFIDAVRMNSGHGRKLNQDDYIRIAIKLRQDFKVPDITISKIIHIPERNVVELPKKVIFDTEGNMRPLKHGYHWLQGKTLTTEQYRIVDTTVSGNVTRMANELASILEHDLANVQSVPVVEALQRLSHALEHVTKRLKTSA